MSSMGKGVVVLALLLLVGVGLGIWGISEDDGRIQLVGAGVERLPAFTFNDLEGKSRQSSEWKGKLLVVNFWATWCPPCLKEMPLFIEFQERYREQGVQFVGIAIDDLQMVQDFYDVYDINFPVVIGGVDGTKLANRMGNRFGLLPFTVIFDRDGKRHYVHSGEMDKATLEAQLLPLM